MRWTLHNAGARHGVTLVTCAWLWLSTTPTLADLSDSDLAAISNAVASALAGASPTGPNAVADALKTVIVGEITQNGPDNAQAISATIIADALADGAPAQSIGDAMGSAALALGAPSANEIADAVSTNGDVGMLQSFDAAVAASPSGGEIQAEEESTSNRRRALAIGEEDEEGGHSGAWTNGFQHDNGEANAVSGPRPSDPNYQPKAIPLGGPFRLFPNIFSSLGYDDNVYRSIGATKASSPIWLIDPTLVLDYDISRARIDLYAQSSYQDLQQYSLWTYDAGLKGQYEFTHAAVTVFNISDGLFYEDFSSANSLLNQKRPTEYSLIDASGHVTFKPNRLGITVGGSFDSYAFTATPLNGLPPEYNGDRNAMIDKGWGELSYDFSPGYSAFVRATYNADIFSHRDHREFALPDPGVDRSSHGYNFDGGVDLLLGNLAQGEFYVGWLDQLYDMNQPHPLKDISGIDFGGNLTWYPTELLVVKLSGARQIQNTTLGGASAGDDISVTLSGDYEVLRRLHIVADAGYDDTTYPGNGRADHAFSLGGGAKFLLSHYVWLNATYQYTNRSSNVLIGRYADNFISAGLNLQD